MAMSVTAWVNKLLNRQSLTVALPEALASEPPEPQTESQLSGLRSAIAAHARQRTTAIRVALVKAGVEGAAAEAQEDLASVGQSTGLVQRDAVPARSIQTMAVVPYFSDFVIREPLRNVAREYADWILGLGDFQDLREARTRAGLPASLQPEDLHPAEMNQGPSLFKLDDPGVILKTRADVGSPGEGPLWRLVFGHSVRPGEPVVGVDAVAAIGGRANWEHHVGLEDVGNGRTRVRHAIKVVSPATNLIRHVSGAPGVIEALLGSGMAQGWPVQGLMRQNLAETQRLVQGLLSPERKIPILLVTSRKREDGGWGPLVNPDELRRALNGRIAVVEVERPERLSADAFLVTMARFGVERHLNVLDGGVRLYQAGMKESDPPEAHRLWSHFFFAKCPEKYALRNLLLEISDQVSETNLPPDFLGSLDGIDRKRRKAKRDEVAERAAEEVSMLDGVGAAGPQEGASGLSQPVVASEGQGEVFKALERQVEALREENQAFGEENERLEGAVRSLWGKLALAHSAPEEAEPAPVQVKVFSKVAKKEPSPGFDAEALAEAVLKGNPSLEEALLYLQVAFPGRVEVLPSALKSAREAVAFRHKDKAWDLQRKLVTDYWHILAEGEGGDAKARNVFGNSFAAKEADIASSSDRGMRLRTFVYRGEPVTMTRHLQIGFKLDAVGETWRLYFHWDSEKRKVVIGHSGRTLDYY